MTRAAIEIGVYAGLVPAVTALVLYWMLGRLLPERLAARYRVGAAFAMAVFLGFLIAPTTKSIVPAQFWDWLPYLSLLAAFAAGVARADGIASAEWWAIAVLMAALSAWLVVPTWEEMAPARSIQVRALAAGIAALALLLEPLASRLAGRMFPFWLMLAAGACSILILAEVSETFGRLAAVPASALAGCGIAAWFAKAGVDRSGLVLPYAVVVGGYAFVGAIYPAPPLLALLLVPFVPLVLWLCARGPVARLTGGRAVAAQAACVLVPLAIIAFVVIMRSAGDDW